MIERADFLEKVLWFSYFCYRFNEIHFLYGSWLILLINLSAIQNIKISFSEFLKNYFEILLIYLGNSANLSKEFWATQKTQKFLMRKVSLKVNTIFSQMNMPFGTFNTLKPKCKESNSDIKNLSVSEPIREILPKKKVSSGKIHDVFSNKLTSVTPIKKIR